MKKFIKIATTLCLVICLFAGGALVLSGCGNNERDLNYGTVTRDPSQIGGASLSFVYDEKTHTATFGGEGQQVEYYEIDESVGRNEAGNRVGIQITAPEEVKDLTKSTLTYNGKTYENGSFLDGDNYVWVYPLFNEDVKTQVIKIRWEPSTKEQTYTVKLADGTTFAPSAVTLTRYGTRNYPYANNGIQNNGVNTYNGRNYNGYNRNIDRIRNGYNSQNPIDNMGNLQNNGTSINGARVMPRMNNNY